MDSVFFSIIIPTYNRGNTISRLIEEILKQGFSDYEVIVVDDGSADNTKDVIEAYLNDDRVHYIFQQNKGVSVARNAGVARSKGQYLIFLDSDDMITSTILHDFYKAILEKPISLAVFAQYQQNGQIRGLKRNSFLFNESVSVIPGSYCIESNIFKEIGGFDENLSHSENWEMMIRLGMHKEMTQEKITSLNKVVLVYNEKYSTEKLLRNKENKIRSYEALYFVHRQKNIYPKRMIAFFAHVAANNHAGVGNFSRVIRWTYLSVKTYPFSFIHYYKPILIFFKRRIIPYHLYKKAKVNNGLQG